MRPEKIYLTDIVEAVDAMALCRLMYFSVREPTWRSLKPPWNCAAS